MKIMDFHLNFFGDGGVGKTTWIKTLYTNHFTNEYVGTVGTEVHPLSVKTNRGTFHLTLCDYAGQEKYSSKGEPYPADATIVMFDLTRKNTYANVDTWFKKCKNEPVFVIGNKNDEERKVMNPSFPNMIYSEMNAKTMTEKDLLTPILRHLTGYADLCIE